MWALSVLLATVSLAMPSVAGVLDAYPMDENTVTQWKLPHKLREISGLVAADARLFAHGDEAAIVYELDYERGRLIKAFALGNPTVRGDFEGIAIVGERFFLVTSDGTLYEFNEGENGARVGYRRYATGFGRQCEIEGLAYDQRNDNLLFACKQPRIKPLRDLITVFAWSVSAVRPDPGRNLSVPLRGVTEHLPGEQFNPSGIEIAASSGNILLVAARQRAVAELGRDGRVIGARRLPRATLHRQAEGIALLPDGRLVLADEGGSKRSRLALYRPVP